MGQQDGQGGWGPGAQPGHLGAPGQWVGPAHIPQPCPRERPPSPPGLPQGPVCMQCGIPEAGPSAGGGGVWDKCGPGVVGNGVPALRSPALPSRPLAPMQTRQGQLGEPGARDPRPSSAPGSVKAAATAYCCRATCQVPGPREISDPSPPASPQEPECGRFLPARKHLLDRGGVWAAGVPDPPARCLSEAVPTSQADCWRDRALPHPQGLSKSTPPAGFLLGEKRK